MAAQGAAFLCLGGKGSGEGLAARRIQGSKAWRLIRGCRCISLKRFGVDGNFLGQIVKGCQRFLGLNDDLIASTNPERHADCRYSIHNVDSEEVNVKGSDRHARMAVTGISRLSIEAISRIRDLLT